jgi:hypothetical protein
MQRGLSTEGFCYRNMKMFFDEQMAVCCQLHAAMARHVLLITQGPGLPEQWKSPLYPRKI